MGLVQFMKWKKNIIFLGVFGVMSHWEGGGCHVCVSGVLEVC